MMFLECNISDMLFALSSSLSVKENRVIVLSIHQPRYSIFKLFDSLSLLSQGEIVYHGKANMALDYFDQLGNGIYTCRLHIKAFQLLWINIVVFMSYH